MVRTWLAAATSDQSVAFTAPSDGTYGFALSTDTAFDSVLYLIDGCDGPELGCARGEPVAVDHWPGRRSWRWSTATTARPARTSWWCSRRARPKPTATTA